MVGVVTLVMDTEEGVAATLWPLLLLPGLCGAGVLEVVGTTDTTATTLVCPVLVTT